MPDNNQKDISSKYQKDIQGYQKTHPFRRLRFWLCLGAFIFGIVWALGFKSFGGSSLFFNTGPISENHRRFEQKCEQCHTGASTDMLAILPVGSAKKTMDQGKDAILASLKSAGEHALNVTKEKLSDPNKLGDAMISALGSLTLDNIDRACLVCHGGMSLHQPGVKAVMFRETVKELSVVSAGACSTCHIEHVGTARMRLPTDETCTHCHGNEQLLQGSFKVAHFDGKAAKPTGQNLVLEKIGGRTVPTGSREGYVENWPIQWVPPATEGHKPKLIRSFADKDPNLRHPDFLYQQKSAQDQAKILFNHKRHLGPMDPATKKRMPAKDIPLIDGQALDCASCHTVDSDGVGMQRISYDQNCKQCHPLAIDPQLPGFTIPHRDPAKVRSFLASLRRQWTDFAKDRYKDADPQQIDAFMKNRENEFVKMWPGGIDDWQKIVFFDGNPNNATLWACVRCHATQASPGAKPEPAVKMGATLPVVERTAIPDQFLTRGPYKHSAHLDMECTDCHKAAEMSNWTQDISLPQMTLCMECHRPRDYDKVPENPTTALAPTFGSFGHLAVVKQRNEGGVFDNCLRCHKYHVPAAEMEIGKALLGTPTAKN